MSKEQLGQVLRRQRESLGLSQRQLATMLGVKASYIGYLEQGRRRPSLTLLRRLADTLGLPKERLLVISHPEAGAMLNARTPSKPRDSKSAWREFIAHKALLARHKITAKELKVLSQVNLLGTISSHRDYIFILNSIRQAVEEEEI